MLQVTRTDPKLQSLLERQLSTKVRLTPQRGEILDNQMRELALSIKMDSLYAHPPMIKDKRRVSRVLAEMLKISESEIYKKLTSKRHFVWIKRLIDPSISEEIKNLEISGLNFIPESKRFYPNKQIAAQAIGFVGVDSRGLEGLELAYNQRLLGKEQVYKIHTDARGRPILAIVRPDVADASNEMLFTNNISKEHIVLTIDKDVQYWAEKELEKAVQSSEAVSGEAVIMDPNTGKILALANYPFVDPNNAGKARPGLLRNRVVTDMFDPGSTFKLFTVAAALDLGKINTKSKIFCENGVYSVDARNKIHEAHGKKFGSLGISDILKHSTNIGTVKIAEKLDNKQMADYFLKFGFNSKTGIDLPGEVSGILRPQKAWKAIDKANISFGQGISVTSIQLVTAFSALVNGGILYKPYVVDRVVDSEFKVVEITKPKVVRERVIKRDTVKAMKDMLAAVVSDKGTGEKAAIAGMSVGGKTGTAQKLDRDNMRYWRDRHIASFIGTFPLEKPKYVIFVKVDDPKINKYASLSAVPAFREIALYLTSQIKREKALVKATIQNPATERANGKKKNLPTIKRISAVKDEAGNEVVDVPDLKNMTLRQMLQLFNGIDLKYDVEGTGKIIAQSPEAGVRVPKGSKIRVILE